MTVDRVRPIPKSMFYMWGKLEAHLILIYLHKIVQDEEGDREFPTGRRDVLTPRDTELHPSQQDPTRDIWVCWMSQNAGETNLVQAALVLDAISWSRKAFTQRDVCRVFPCLGRKTAE